MAEFMDLIYPLAAPLTYAVLWLLAPVVVEEQPTLKDYFERGR
jgi:hypothetical protein